MTSSLTEGFAKNGYLLLKGFYEVQRDIQPIQEVIRQIIQHMLRQNDISAPCDNWEEASTLGAMALIAKDRRLGAQLYDAVKHVPGLGRLVHKNKNELLYEQLRNHVLPAVAYDGYGIRIDFPNEENFRTYWHQEFPAQQRSLDGVVFWTPLVPISPEVGPVELAEKSHLEGPIATIEDSGGVGRTGAYKMKLPQEEKLIGKYNLMAPLTEPGDLLVMDYLTLHQSGHNISERPRWSVQFRLFNYNNKTGVESCWQRQPEPSANLINMAKADYLSRGVDG